MTTLTNNKITYNYSEEEDGYFATKKVKNIKTGSWVNLQHFFDFNWTYESTTMTTDNSTIPAVQFDEAQAVVDAHECLKTHGDQHEASQHIAELG